MGELPTLDELLRRKAVELDSLDRPRQRAEAAQRDLEAARGRYWQLLEEFVERAREVAVLPRMWTPPSRDGYTPRIVWIEGYPLLNDTVISVPPLRYCSAERRKVRRVLTEVIVLDELTLFVPGSETEATSAHGGYELHTASGGVWPPIRRLEHASTILTALESRLEKSLLALMD